MTKTTTTKLHTTKLFELPIITDPFKEVFASLAGHRGAPLLVATPNPEQVVLSQEDPQFQQSLLAMDLLLPDGAGLVLASRVFAAAGSALPIYERIAGVEMVEALLSEAATENKTVLVIGGRGYERYGVPAPEFSNGSVYKLKLPGTETFYWLEGYENAQQPQEREEKLVTQVIKKLAPAYVFIALGAPLQEQWLVTHQELLAQAKVRVAMAVGGAFDMLTGNLDRAPSWMLQLHLEWLYRLWQEPWRWRRQLKLLKFVKLVVQELIN